MVSPYSQIGPIIFVDLSKVNIDRYMVSAENWIQVAISRISYHYRPIVSPAILAVGVELGTLQIQVNVITHSSDQCP